MSRIVVRRAGNHADQKSGPSLSTTVLALAVGGGLALLVHQIWKASVEEQWHPGLPLPRESSIPAIESARAALDSDTLLRDAGLSIIPGGRGSLELHGWVSDRKARARAARLVAEAIAPVALVNSVLVHGEDDADEEYEEYLDDDAVPA